MLLAIYNPFSLVFAQTPCDMHVYMHRHMELLLHKSGFNYYYMAFA